jgi:hypothetical protein
VSLLVVLAAVPWTYWMAPVLFVAAVVVDLTIAVLYFRRFVLPRLVVRLTGEDGQVVQHPVQLRQLQRREATAETAAPSSEAA